MTTANLELVSGDDVVLELTVRDSVSSEPVNLTGCSAIFAIGRANSRRIVTTKIIGNGITVVDASAGRLNVEIDAEDTEELSGVFRHELQILSATGKRATPLRGSLEILQDLIET